MFPSIAPDPKLEKWGHGRSKLPSRRWTVAGWKGRTEPFANTSRLRAGAMTVSQHRAAGIFTRVKLARAGKTVIAPARSLEVLANGSVRPFHPATVHLRDGNLLRRWPHFSSFGSGRCWGTCASTAAWLKANSGSLDKITYTVTAANKKRRAVCGVPSCAFSATVRVSGNDHRK